jgi:hypothetical protein
MSLEAQALACRMVPAVGLTVLSDAHLQKVLLFLNPLKCLISEVYEALQKNYDNGKK